MEKRDIVIVMTDDWEGLYIDGQCVVQSHRICGEDVLDALGIEYEIYEPTRSFGAYLPDRLEDVIQ